MQLNLILPTLADGNVYHVYCSIYNEGAEQLFQEAMHVCGKAWHMSDVQVCTDRAHLAECNCFILYLNARTWSNEALSKYMLEEELAEAMEAGVQLCLAHEMSMFVYPGSTWDQINPVDGEKPTSSRTRHACDFGDFFALTPKRLLEQKLYNTIATPLKGGQWRAVSLKMFAKQLFGLLDSAAMTEEFTSMERIPRDEKSHFITSRMISSKVRPVSSLFHPRQPRILPQTSSSNVHATVTPTHDPAGASSSIPDVWVHKRSVSESTAQHIRRQSAEVPPSEDTPLNIISMEPAMNSVDHEVSLNTRFTGATLAVHSQHSRVSGPMDAPNPYQLSQQMCAHHSPPTRAAPSPPLGALPHARRTRVGVERLVAAQCVQAKLAQQQCANSTVIPSASPTSAVPQVYTPIHPFQPDDRTGSYEVGD